MKKLLFLTSLLCIAAPLAAQPAAPETAPKATKTVIKPKAAKAPKVAKMAGTSHIRVFHAMEGGPSVDVVAGTTKIASNLAFKGISPYMEMKSGKNSFKVVGAGKTDPAIISEDKTLTKNKFFTLCIMGKEKAALLFINDSTGKEMPDKARVKAIHLAPGAPDVILTVPSERGTKGYAVFLGSAAKPLGYAKSASKTAKPMTAKLQVRTLDGKIVKEIADVKLEAGKRYDAFAIGEVGTTFDVVIKPAAVK